MEERIIGVALQNGATVAGIARTADLKRSPSHRIYPRLGDYRGVGTVKDGDGLQGKALFDWPDSAPAVLVIGLGHPPDRPELDWWDGRGTPGNRQLMEIARRTRLQVEAELGVETLPLHYYVERGGALLKDAAVLAGLGCVGRNNLLLNPGCGPRLRLRAVLLEAGLEPTGPVAFDPCPQCRVRCRSVCPEGAMKERAGAFDGLDAIGDLPARDGSYDRILCNVRMEKDVSESETGGPDGSHRIRYCRRCEFVCPVGKKKDPPAC